LTVDAKKVEPIYRQIFDPIVLRIETHAFPHGFKLPPSRTLARELSTHRNTVARAYADLEAAGFVSSTVGRGTFVEAQAARSKVVPERERPAGRMSWGGLLSRGAQRDRLGRAERYARRADGRDVVNLARMQPSADLLPGDLIRRSIERVFSELGARAMTYAPPEGVPALREQVAIELASRGVPAAADDVLITSGSQQAIDIVARALVNPGDTVLVDAATYSGAIELFTLAGAHVLPVPSDGLGPDIAALGRLVRPDVKALYLMPSGHNPTGVTIPLQRRRELVAWSQAAGIPIIEDDYGAGITLDEGDALPHLRALDGDVIHISTFSKRLVPALRIGFIVCPPAVRHVFSSLKRVMDLGTSAILQHALADFMERGYLRAHTKKALPEYRARLDALDGALRKALPPEIHWTRPSHGVVLWLRLPDWIDPDAVYTEALKCGVIVSPSPMWSVEMKAENGLRLTFCAEPTERLVQGARRLGKAFKVLSDAAPRKHRRGPSAVEVV
jgi:GntR family transcriptional regulator/MocR family aminotransferase